MCKLMVVERSAEGEPLTVDALRRHVEGRLARAPRLAQKLLRTPLGLAHPVWADDPEFDIAHHVRRVEVDGPVDRKGLFEIVAGLMAERLDRSRPLWRLDLVDSLADGKTALVWRIHHCMADGLTAFKLGSQAIWESERDATPAPHQSWSAAPQPGALALAALGARDRVRGAFGGMAAAARTVRRSPGHARAALGAVLRTPAMLVRELAPRAAPTALDRHPGPVRVVATAAVPLADVKRIGKSLGDGITVNDVVLSAVGGALRRWLEDRGEGLTGIRAKVPTSLHHQDSSPDALGNHDSFMFVDLAVSDQDAVERLRDVNRSTRTCKVHRDPQALYDFYRDVHAFARPVENLASRWAMSPDVFTLNISNVPGPGEPIFVLGHSVREFHSFAEIADRHALRVAVVSVAGTISFGLCADRAAVSHVGTLAEGIEAELAELAAAADAVRARPPARPQH
jgi:WS/DGAT/MGAT family acyltransferase